MVSFALEEIIDERTGQRLQAVVKTETFEGTQTPVKETWCTILDLDRLFDACAQKWGANWNLDKVIEAIRGSEIA